MAFWIGFRTTFSVFYVALLDEFPWGRGESAGVQSMALITYTITAPLVGGLIEIVPMFLVKENVPTIASVKPYTPLEVLGRDLYIREGCVGCHSQMVRPFRSETERYGEYSKVGEYIYDHPFLWGSKRTGPDLHRVGGKYPDAWHYNHMEDPRSTSPGSIMPAYPWLLAQELDTSVIQPRMKALRRTGIPYTDEEITNAQQRIEVQSQTVVANLAAAFAQPAGSPQRIRLAGGAQARETAAQREQPEVRPSQFRVAEFRFEPRTVGAQRDLLEFRRLTRDRPDRRAAVGDRPFHRQVRPHLPADR